MELVFIEFALGNANYKEKETPHKNEQIQKETFKLTTWTSSIDTKYYLFYTGVKVYSFLLGLFHSM